MAAKDVRCQRRNCSFTDGLKAGVADVRKTNVQPSFVIPEVTEGVLLTALAILVNTYRTRKTGDFDGTTTGMILCLHGSGTALSQ
jgi:hypothetical protein